MNVTTTAALDIAQCLVGISQPLVNVVYRSEVATGRAPYKCLLSARIGRTKALRSSILTQDVRFSLSQLVVLLEFIIDKRTDQSPIYFSKITVGSPVSVACLHTLSITY